MFRAIVCLATALLFAGSASAEPVWLVSNGFHTSVAVRTRDLPSDLRSLVADPAADHLLIGWGAAIYYTARKVTPIVCCRATFFPTASALHIVPVRGPLARRFPHSDIFRFETTPTRIRQLCGFLRDALARDREGNRRLLGSGYFAGSQFYAGREIFWFPVTCNIWSARALRRAGVDLPIFCSFAAPGLTWHARSLGRREQYRRLPVDGF
jgi:uncharacterized protein (TIGR02117 family)